MRTVRAVLFGGLAVSLMAWPEARQQDPQRPVFPVDLPLDVAATRWRKPAGSS